MMGDDMAIRSGGMYGDPASSYTIARPVANTQGLGGGITPIARFAKMGLNIGAAYGDYIANTMQIDKDLRALRREKEYNVKNFEQKMADTLASNIMSFYARDALQEDLGMLTYNYGVQEEALKRRRRDLKSKLALDVGSSVLSMF